MIFLVVYIATVLLIRLVLEYVPLEREKKKRIWSISACIATLITFLFYYKNVKQSIDKSKLNQLTRSESFSQASMVSGGSLLSTL